MKKTNKPVLLGCGILKDEVRYLVKKNGWDMDTFFLDSSLHVDFDKLYNALDSALKKHEGRETFVFYGACHPNIDVLTENRKTVRTLGQNCIEILLGKELFTRELSQGAFFLMEDWVRRWDYVTTKAMGGDNESIKAVFLSEHTYFLALKTVCSTDFSKEAEAISRSIGLPLKWMEVELDHLEKVLIETIREKGGGVSSGKTNGSEKKTDQKGT